MKEKLMSVLWPAFLAAGALEMLVFAFIDPEDLHTWGGGATGLDRTAIYSIAFFVLWAAFAACSAVTIVLARSPFAVDDYPRRRDGRPDDPAGLSPDAPGRGLP